MLETDVVQSSLKSLERKLQPPVPGTRMKPLGTGVGDLNQNYHYDYWHYSSRPLDSVVNRGASHLAT